MSQGTTPTKHSSTMFRLALINFQQGQDKFSQKNRVSSVAIKQVVGKVLTSIKALSCFKSVSTKKSQM